MPFDTAILDGDFVPMNHREVQPISAKALRCYDETGAEIAGYHHIVRGDTGATIRVAPEASPLIQNEFLVDAIEQALARSKLDLTDARFGADYSHDGARMFAQWIMPAHTSQVRPDVEASLRVIVVNAYDGSAALAGRIGAFNWACANQSFSGKEYSSFRFLHAGKLGEVDILPAIGKLATAAELHVEQVRRWTRWPQIRVSDIEARAVLTKLPQASKGLVDELVHAWLKARDEDPIQGGANLWCLFNVLTAWASSKVNTQGSTNRAFRNWERQTRVAEVMETKTWAEIEGVAV